MIAKRQRARVLAGGEKEKKMFVQECKKELSEKKVVSLPMHVNSSVPPGGGRQVPCEQRRGVLCDESIDLPLKSMGKDRLSG